MQTPGPRQEPTQEISPKSSTASRRQGVRAPISACLIVQNEQERLPACLASLDFCDETIVVDGGSHDGTVQCALAAGARVIESPWRGYAAQRNVALEHASHDWVLEIDADERISDELRQEIETFLQAPPEDIDNAALPIRHVFLGRRLGPSVRYPTYRIRLFRRSRYRHDETRAVHEGIRANGSTHPFTGDLEHRLADSWGEALRDCWSYARLEAGHLPLPAGWRSYPTGIVLRPATKFAWRTVVFAAWRDGWQGLAQVALQSISDGLVWSRLLVRRLREPALPSESADAFDGHFAQHSYRGPARLVAVADNPPAVERASEWLTRASQAGADVALISPPLAQPHARDDDAWHAQELRRLSLLDLIRAVDMEMQLRSIDALIAFGPRAERLLPRLPRAVRGSAVSLVESTEPLEAIERGLNARPTTSED
jgi:glycosyltransferase involved in cell wall biosynthesis